MSAFRPRIMPIDVRQLSALPTTCSGCVLGGGLVPGRDVDGEPATWARSAQAAWGFCGVGAFAGERVVGYLLATPPLHVPRTGPQSGGGLNPDAAVIMSLRVVEPYRGSGLGRQLVQAAAARLIRTQFQALEVRATSGPGACVLPPVAFLEAVGFVEVAGPPCTPRMRLEFSRTLRWVPDLRPAWERLVGWARPLPPEPAGRTPVRCGSSLGSGA